MAEIPKSVTINVVPTVATDLAITCVKLINMWVAEKPERDVVIVKGYGDKPSSIMLKLASDESDAISMIQKEVAE